METSKNLENELKALRITLSVKEDQVIDVQKSLDRERDEKMALIEEKSKDEEIWQSEKTQWQLERQDLEQQISELIKMTQNAKMNEEANQAFNKVLGDKESLENENALLKQEIKRFQLIISNPNEIDHIKSSTYDEDFGYSSSRNTLEKHHKHKSSSNLNEGEFHSIQGSNIQNSSTTSTFERKLKSLFGFSNRGGLFLHCFMMDEGISQETNKSILKERGSLTELIILDLGTVHGLSLIVQKVVMSCYSTYEHSFLTFH